MGPLTFDTSVSCLKETKTIRRGDKKDGKLLFLMKYSPFFLAGEGSLDFSMGSFKIFIPREIFHANRSFFSQNRGRSQIFYSAVSARGCRQTLTPIGSGERFRTLEGQLVMVGAKEKYRSVIECSDLYPPALDALWPGARLTIACITPLITPSLSGGSRILLSEHLYPDPSFSIQIKGNV